EQDNPPTITDLDREALRDKNRRVHGYHTDRTRQPERNHGTSCENPKKYRKNEKNNRSGCSRRHTDERFRHDVGKHGDDQNERGKTENQKKPLAESTDVAFDDLSDGFAFMPQRGRQR